MVEGFMPKTTISSAITPSKGRTERDGRLDTSSRGAKGPLDEIRLLIKIRQLHFGS